MPEFYEFRSGERVVGIAREDVRAALRQLWRHGGADVPDCSHDCGFRHSVNPEDAMARALLAALESRAKREARDAYRSLDAALARRAVARTYARGSRLS